MARDYLIAVGGTGARCLDAAVYLAAAGLQRRALHVLIVDPDQNNGNSVRARQVMTDYHAINVAEQPPRPQTASFLGMGSTRLPDPSLFVAAINRASGRGNAQQQVFWHNPNTAERKFKQVIDYQAQASVLQEFLDLFYESGDLEMVLDVGYRGRTNVGAVALKQDMEGTAAIENSGLREFLANLNEDLQAGEARVFVMGSVFGGTGAAGLPTIPRLIDSLPEDIRVISRANRERIRYGCAMLTPYFSFPQSEGGDEGPGTDSARHAVATQAALMHYAHVPPGYQHVYFIGAPVRPHTNRHNVIGGQQQFNAPHYAELIAGLAAWDFFQLGEVSPDDKRLHFADTLQQGQEQGVNWRTLPVHPDAAFRREEVKQRMVAFTTFLYFYKNYLYHDFVNHRAYKTTDWYRNNFGDLTLDDQGTQLRHLYDFALIYLDWLRQFGETGGQASLQLFNWPALQAEGKELCSPYLGNMMYPGTANPKHANDGYDLIQKNLNGLKLKQPGTTSATGLFVYLLYHAVEEFCRDNYAW
ncbi:MAG TPA: hypothetical protein VF297_22315 [Pyrinomonadaceae bacterium]